MDKIFFNYYWNFFKKEKIILMLILSKCSECLSKEFIFILENIWNISIRKFKFVYFTVFLLPFTYKSWNLINITFFSFSLTTKWMLFIEKVSESFAYTERRKNKYMFEFTSTSDGNLMQKYRKIEREIKASKKRNWKH